METSWSYDSIWAGHLQTVALIVWHNSVLKEAEKTRERGASSRKPYIWSHGV